MNIQYARHSDSRIIIIIIILCTCKPWTDGRSLDQTSTYKIGCISHFPSYMLDYHSGHHSENLVSRASLRHWRSECKNYYFGHLSWHCAPAWLLSNKWVLQCSRVHGFQHNAINYSLTPIQSEIHTIQPAWCCWMAQMTARDWSISRILL